jgi:aryl-alcohol dehydrogenase-like predicted oxidoreductase
MKRFVEDERNMVLLDAMDEMAKNYNGTLSQVAIAWMLANPLITSPIIGANNNVQLNELLGSLHFKLSADEIKTLDDLTAWQMQS